MSHNVPNGQLRFDMGTSVALHDLEQSLRMDHRPKLVMSDFDDTLCHRYTFDPQTHTSLPVIDPAVAAAAHELPLLIATATRVAHPKIDAIWASGMLASRALLIAENGGVIIEQDRRVWWSAVDESGVHEVERHVRGELPVAFRVPEDMRLVIKRGMTLLIARAQRQDGTYDAHVHTELQQALQDVVGPSWAVIDSGRSLTVQPSNVSKINALPHTGLERNEYCLIGMGDSPNDMALLAAADIAIAVGDRLTEHANFQIAANDSAVAAALRVIGKTATTFRGWRKDTDAWPRPY